MKQINYLMDGRTTVILNQDDVDLAKLYFQEGKSRMEVIKEFRDSGFSYEQAVCIAFQAQGRTNQ